VRFLRVERIGWRASRNAKRGEKGGFVRVHTAFDGDILDGKTNLLCRAQGKGAGLIRLGVRPGPVPQPSDYPNMTTGWHNH
jgi:hypothetical protein